MKTMDLMRFLDISDFSTHFLKQCGFYPTNSELIGFHLKNKILGLSNSPFILDADMYGKKKNPWDLFCDDDLPWQRLIGQPECRTLFVFTLLSNVGKTKLSSNKQKNRVAGDGTWRVNGKEHAQFDDANKLIGYVRSLTFRSKKPTVGQWNMDEFSINPEAYPEELSGLDCQDLVLCQIKRKDSSKTSTRNQTMNKKRKCQHTNNVVLDDDSCISDVEVTADLEEEAQSKRQKVALDVSDHGCVDDSGGPAMPDASLDFVDPNTTDREFVELISFDCLE